MMIGPDPIKSIDSMSVRFGMQSSKNSTGSRHGTYGRMVRRRLRRGIRPSIGRVIQRQDLRQPSFNLIDTSHIGRMGGEKLWYCLLGPETQFIDHLARAA